MPVVTALRATRRGLIALHIDGEFVCSVSESLLARWHLYQGREIGVADVQALQEQALVERARADAHRLLAQRLRARSELAARLRQKDHPDEIVSVVLAELEHAGLLDDAAFAAAFTADRRRLAGWGDQRIHRQLKSFGVASAHIEAALGLGDDEQQLALARAALARYGRPQPPLEAAKGRAFQLLRRRGFSTNVSYRAVADWVSGVPNATEQSEGDGP
jgi:regulatory protein